MDTPAMKRIGLLLIVAALALIALHAVSLQAAARMDLVATLLSPGGHSPLFGLAFALAFLVLRVLALVVGPALLAAGVVAVAMSFANRP
jgi:hypothetical protein